MSLLRYGQSSLITKSLTLWMSHRSSMVWAWKRRKLLHTTKIRSTALPTFVSKVFNTATHNGPGYQRISAADFARAPFSRSWPLFINTLLCWNWPLVVNSMSAAMCVDNRNCQNWYCCRNRCAEALSLWSLHPPSRSSTVGLRVAKRGRRSMSAWSCRCLSSWWADSCTAFICCWNMAKPLKPPSAANGTCGTQ